LSYKVSYSTPVSDFQTVTVTGHTLYRLTADLFQAFSHFLLLAAHLQPIFS
jgi:hypothetical protein